MNLLRTDMWHLLSKKRFSVVARIAAAAGLALSLCLTACTTDDTTDGEQLDKDSSGRALLDAASGEIIMPLTEYDQMDDSEEAMLGTVAADLYMKNCMTGKGQPYSAIPVTDISRESIGDRPYGLWNVRTAATFGFVPVRSGDEEGRAQPEQDSTWREAAQSCKRDGNATMSTFLPDDNDPSNQLILRIADTARTAAARDPESTKVWKEWKACIKKQGLTPKNDRQSVMSQQAEAAINEIGENGQSPVKEEEIRVATIEAQCDQETKKTQRLADLEAAYQLPLIEENQAALNQAKTEKQARVRAARDYIAQHG